MDQSAVMENTSPASKVKFILGGLLIVAAVVYLIVTATMSNQQFFLTVDEMMSQSGSIQGRAVKLSGAVIGESIQYDPQTLTLTFTIAAIPGDNAAIDAQGGLAKVLHEAVSDPSRQRVTVIYEGVKPDLLRDEAQAILTGKLGADGNFYADELLLKCPTKYEEAVPEQAEG
jgi:cytochrome c-type biogenesis protein CcmE